jgi:cytochrome c oxidase subunit 2
MTAFLVVLVIILFGVAVWQMGKIFQMSKSKDTGDSEIASDKDNNINGYLMLGFVFFTYILLIYCFWEWVRYPNVHFYGAYFLRRICNTLVT